MKSTKGNLWYEKQQDGVMNIGFTQTFIQQALNECFHILPADSRNVLENGALLVIETNDGVQSLKSPVTGTIVEFNTKARNFPDRIKEEDVILKVLPKGVVIPTVAKPAVKKAPESPPQVRTIAELREQYRDFAWTDDQLRVVQLGDRQARNAWLDRRAEERRREREQQQLQAQQWFENNDQRL
jgi:hypothetical protein